MLAEGLSRALAPAGAGPFGRAVDTVVSGYSPSSIEFYGLP